MKEILITVLTIASILLIALVLLQSGKAESASGIITGASGDLFKNRKERGSELVISRTTLFLGLFFILVCLTISIIE